MKYGKIYTYENRHEAEIGKKYVFSDLYKNIYSEEISPIMIHSKLVKVEDCAYPFKNEDGCDFQFIREVIEDQVFMTNRQFSELMAKGYGEWKHSRLESIMTESLYTEPYEDKPVGDNVMVRAWGSDEWRVPTADIYENFCHPKCREDV